MPPIQRSSSTSVVIMKEIATPPALMNANLAAGDPLIKLSANSSTREYSDQASIEKGWDFWAAELTAERGGRQNDKQ